MNLTAKERLRRAIRHEPLDYLPTQINYTARQGERMVAHFGVALKDLPHRLGNHLLRLELAAPPHYNEDRSVKFDWWGAGFDTGEEGYFVRVSPLQDHDDLDAFLWPDASDPGLLADAAAAVDADQGEHFLVPNFGWALFERAWSLRGLADFMMDMAGDPLYAGELLDRIADIQLALIQRFLSLGVDGFYFGDDYGGQVNMLLSPQMWRKLIKPRLARLFEPIRAAGLPILMHSDGHIEPILPDLVEIGLTMYNPVQPEVTDFTWLRQTFGNQLAYYGGVSTQSTMPFGTPADVRTAVLHAAAQLAPDRTGLLIAPSHRMMSDVPMHNVAALLDAFAELRGELR